MAFVRITDPDKATELYRAGLLWERRVRNALEDQPYEPAFGWFTGDYPPSGIALNIQRGLQASFEFYILLED